MDRLVLRLRDPLEDYPLAPGVVPLELDRRLGTLGAKSWTLFLGIATEGDGAARARLVKRGAMPVELFDPDSGEPPLEGVLVVDLKGAQARKLGRELGTARLLRGLTGRPFDPQPQRTDDESMLDSAGQGLVAMARMFRQLPRRLEASSVATLAAAVLLLAAWAAAYFTSLPIPDRLSPRTAQVLGPLLFFGAFLRWRVHGAALGSTAAEAPGWERIRYELFAVWLAAVPLVLAFGAAGLWRGERLTADALFDRLPTPLVLVLWTLPAVSLARSAGELFGNLIAAGFNAFLNVLILKLAYWVAGLASDVLWSIVSPILLRALPESLVDPVGVAFGILAELAFLFTLLGYAWTRQRAWFDGDPHPLEA